MKGRAVIALLLGILGVACSGGEEPAPVPKRTLNYSDATFGAALGEIRGHHFVCLELYRNGDTAGALAHAGHPIAEVLATVDGVIRDVRVRTAAELSGALNEVVKAVEGKKKVADVAKAMASAAEAARSAERVVLGGLADDKVYTGSVVAALLTTASQEYGEAVRDGRIEAVVEYQDAYGFIRVAEQVYAAIRPEIMRVGAIEGRAIDGAFDRLETFLPLATPPATAVRFEEVRAYTSLVGTRIQETVGAILAPRRTPQEIGARIGQLLDEMVAAYRRADTDLITTLASEIYLRNYELIEIDIIRVAERINTELEPLLAEGLRDKMVSRAPEAEVRTLVDRAKRLVAEAVAALRAAGAGS